MNVQDALVQQINQYCQEERWFWVAGLAREVWPALVSRKDELCAIALQAVEHYEEKASGDCL